ncbi:mitogen-activated protein kinase kinase kinase 7 [Dioscorea cayenensis subsp. rotundata]|uniref:Mitogen-activated protein kinase kinase kinase 7 n=1 Tax=Dioscorea cayennensis subsp. rotundata TaxID=55577 RepID=A0AB40ALV9_DIOCR|nr:mitogen-activated protein kinase kinase kinase 7 [Dioscorea cayenensis subsp. rotundata]
MEQFRQIGEVIGSLKVLMVFQDEIRINQRQCCLLVDAFDLAFDVIKEEIHKNLCFSERLTKWKALDQPLKELQRIFREGEHFIRQCLETKDWWGKAVLMNQSTECVDFHLHNLLWCIPVILEAIECAAEISGSRQEDVQKKKIVFSKKYERDWMEPMIFQFEYGKQYLVSPEMCHRMETAWREDRWILSEMISDKKYSGISKQENRLGELLLAPRGKFFPTSLLLNSKDYQFRRRLGTGGKYKEIQWMGESFVVKHLIGEIDPIAQEVSLQSSVTHPNVMHIMYAFADEEKKESFLLMELMHRDLSGYIREVSSSKRRIPFPLLIAVDIMLQIARGMEHLHLRKIYHGELNPSNVFVRTRNSSHDIGYLQAKITGFGVSAMNQTPSDTCIWYAPEVLEEQERSADSTAFKYSEKADVYSFGMICFELLTGKVPFEDSHLQGGKMSRNIKAGERPLFPSPSPKYLTNLVKKCWQAEPSQRPNFTSICRVLRYIKRFLLMNPDHSQLESLMPNVDYFELEMSLSKKYASWARKEPLQVSEIPFQMFAYRILEREKNSMNIIKDKSSESGSEDASLCGDETARNLCTLDDSLSGSVTSSKSSLGSSDTPKSSQVSTDRNKNSSTKKVNRKDRKETGQRQKVKPVRPLQTTRMNSRRNLQPSVVPSPRRTSGNSADTELP